MGRWTECRRGRLVAQQANECQRALVCLGHARRVELDQCLQKLMRRLGLTAITCDAIPEVTVGQARVVFSAMRPHGLVNESCEAARLVPEHAGDHGGIGGVIPRERPPTSKSTVRELL